MRSILGNTDKQKIEIETYLNTKNVGVIQNVMSFVEPLEPGAY